MAAGSASLVLNNLNFTVKRRPAFIRFIQPPENISREAQKFCSRHGLLPSEQFFIHDVIMLKILSSLAHIESQLGIKNSDGPCREKERSMFQELAEYEAPKSRRKRRKE